MNTTKEAKIMSINHEIDQAVNVNDLTKMLVHMPVLNKLQNFMKQIVTEFDEETINKIYYNGSSINHILPDDIIQNIISYNPHSMSIKLINKSFNKLSKKGKFIPDFHQNFQGNTWIIDPITDKLTDKQLALGYKGPLKHIYDGILACYDGDKLLISEGVYDFDEYVAERDDWNPLNPQHKYFTILDTWKSISFIGIGNVTIKNPLEETNQSYFRNLYFENIHFETVSCHTIEAKQLFLKKCKWISNSRNCIVAKGDIYLEDCSFVGQMQFGCHYAPHIVIEAECKNAVINGCTFSDGAEYDKNSEIHNVCCILIKEECSSELNLKIIGNKFISENNIDHVIGFGAWKPHRDDEECLIPELTFVEDGECLLKHNIVTGCEEEMHPNKIYVFSDIFEGEFYV